MSIQFDEIKEAARDLTPNQIDYLKNHLLPAMPDNAASWQFVMFLIHEFGKTNAADQLQAKASASC